MSDSDRPPPKPRDVEEIPLLPRDPRLEDDDDGVRDDRPGRLRAAPIVEQVVFRSHPPTLAPPRPMTSATRRTEPAMPATLRDTLPPEPAPPGDGATVDVVHRTPTLAAIPRSPTPVTVMRAPTPAPVASAARTPTPVRVATPTPSPPAPPPAVAAGIDAHRIDRFLRRMSDRGASDLHLSVGRPPMFRSNGRLEVIRYRTLDRGDFFELLRPITPDDVWSEFIESGDVDFAHEVPGLARFRVNLFRHERGDGAVLRAIPSRLMGIPQLALPDSVRRIARLRSGLVLVTGPTGSGKSTTLAAIVDEMNASRRMHLVTIEDPIEFVHENKLALVSQREVGRHSESFASALRSAVREDPDAILVGELRDLDTIAMALSAAETGVLVLGTLHTNSAAKTVDRIVGVFPADRQPGIRGTLASTLKAVVAQQLVPAKKGGRCAAVEVLFGSTALAAMIRDGRSHQIPGHIKLGRRDGMAAMDDALRKLVEDDLVEPLVALDAAADRDDFRSWLRERGVDAPNDAD